MDVPSSSNVTGRRKRPVREDNDDDFPGGTPVRKLRGTKRQNPANVVSDSLMAKVNEKVDEIVNRKKIGAANCFEYKGPLELCNIEKMIEANASIQEMAIVLESAQMIISHRVDRLHHDVRNVDAIICGRDMGRTAGVGEESVVLSMDDRKAKKKMAIADGLSGVSDVLNQFAEEETTLDRARRALTEIEDAEYLDIDIDQTAGEAQIDLKANSKDVDLFLQRDIFPAELIKDISIERGVNFLLEVSQNGSPCVSSDDTIHDLKDSNIDWLKSNAMFQKATKGGVDNTANFHSLNHYGLHSPSGRTLALHPRIQDKNENDRFFTSDVTTSLAKNMRGLLENSLAKKPNILDNYLMLEVRDRPVIGKYQIVSRDIKKSTLPLAEAARERDLANLTFAEMNRANNYADATIGDMTMLPGNQGLPLADVEQDETVVGDPAGINRTISTGGKNKGISDEYIPPSFESIDLEESLIGKVSMDPMDMDKLSAMFDEKLNEYSTSDSIESKLWRNGLRAEEWGLEDEAAVKAETRSLVTSGIDGWIKATDAWTNYEPVRMIVTRESCFGMDEEHESCKNVQPTIGNHLFLVKSDEYMSSYPGDRSHEFKMAGEELDVMKMTHGADGEEDDRPLEQIQRELLQMNVEDLEMDHDGDDDRGSDSERIPFDFDDHLAAPADTDDYFDPVNANDDLPAEILFNNHIDEPEEEITDERVVQRGLEAIALGQEEVPHLMTAAPPPETIGPSAEMREEIRNIGKNDNAHWIPPEIADNERQTAALLRMKRRDKKNKVKKATVEEYAHYFRDIPEEERDREVTAVKCRALADEKSTFLHEGQVYLQTLGTENKPHIAVDITSFTNSGLFFRADSEIPSSIRNKVVQKMYGRLHLERSKKEDEEAEELFAEDNKGNKESDCLSWLLSFSGFKCMENPVPVSEADISQATLASRVDDNLQTPYIDEEYDRFNSRYAQDLAYSQMGEENQRKMAHFSSSLYHLQSEFRAQREYGEFEDSDDEYADEYEHHTIQAKNLDAAKHKKCLADILNNQTLSMPCIQYALEQLNLQQQQQRKNNTTVHPNTTDHDITEQPAHDLDATLKTVFDYNSPGEVNHNVKEIMEALTDIIAFVDTEAAAPNPDAGRPSSSKYGTANTENRSITIKGLHTLLSLAISMPSKMGEKVKPSSIVSFLLHIANENCFKIVQDRSKKQWMTDFVILNQSDNLPTGLTMGNIDEQGEFWMRTQDPDAVEGTSGGDPTMFHSFLAHAKSVIARKNRAGRPDSPLDTIGEEEEADRTQ